MSIIRRCFGINSLGYAFEESKFDRYSRLQHSKTSPKFFWSFQGIESREPNIRFLADRMLITNKITFQELLSGFHAHYSEILDCICKMDISPVQHLLEPRLSQNISIALGTLREESKSLQLFSSPDFPDDKPTLNIVDSLVYRGLSIDREANKSILDYHVYYDEHIGVACFTDHLLSNPMGYTDQAAMEELHHKNRQTVLQMMVWIRSPVMLRVFKDGEDVSGYNKEYTYNQQWVFESQCTQPQWMKKEEKNESYLEWMGKFRPEKFIVTDMNEFMNINPLCHKKSQK